MSEAFLLADLRVAQRNRERGIPRYSQSLLLAIAGARPDLAIACLIDPGQAPPLMLEQLSRDMRIVEGPQQIAKVSRQITHFLQAGLFQPGMRPAELFPEELAAHRPRLGAIIYDLIPWLFSDVYLGDGTARRDYFAILRQLPELDRVFAISESVRRDVIAVAGVDPHRVATIYGGLDEDRWLAIHKPPSAEAQARVDGETTVHIVNEDGDSFDVKQPFWLNVGGDDYRKNLPALLEASAELKRSLPSTPTLIVACSMARSRRAELYRDATRLGLLPGVDVVFTGYVSDSELGRLFDRCMATIFPSLYEGLGLPVVESYLFNKPVLASDTSSMRELTPASCRFDPTRPSSIANAMDRFLAHPDLAIESLAFGRSAVEMCRWPHAAESVSGWIDGAAHEESPRQDPLWVATSLPPDKSGVAFYTQQSLASPSAPVAFFAPTRTARDLDEMRLSVARARQELGRECAPAEILAQSTLMFARELRGSHPVVFVVGNSEHHIPTLQHLLDGNLMPGDAVHLHDVFLGDLLAVFFGSEARMRDALSRSYPADLVEAWINQGASTLGGGGQLLGPRLLTVAAGVKHFIVNSAAARERLILDLGPDAVNVQVDVLFLPILPADRPNAEPSPFRIAHFGIPGKAKRPDVLVAACDILAKTHPVDLLFAGYEAGRYLREQGLGRDYIRIVEAPSDAELQDLMAGVACAVQLRYPDHGESSGVVNQLLALRRPVICTATGSFLDLADALYLVEPEVSPAALASTIKRAADLGWPSGGDRLIAERSPVVFERRLREVLGLAV